MVFGSRTRLRTCEDIPIFINGDVIERVDEFKYLGIYLDEGLTFERHSKYIYNKASSKLGAIRKIREYIDQPTALRLYKSLVLPHFDYCDTIYMTSSKEVLNKLQLLQNSVCRTLLLANRETHIQDMHTELGLLYLNERRQLHFCLQLHKIIYSIGDVALREFFVPVVPVTGRITRGQHKHNVKVGMCRSELGRKAIRFRCPYTWNNLPVVAKGLERFLDFKRWVSAKVHDLFGDHPV